MKPSVYKAYFKDIAENHKSILHSDDNNKRFAGMNIEEVLTGLRSDLDTTGYCLILENFEGRLADNRSDNILNYKSCAFWVIKNAPSNDYATEEEVIDGCYDIAFDIISKINSDKIPVPRNTMVKHFDPSTVTYNRIVNVFDSCHGYRVSFELHNHQSLKFEPSKWNY
jgi:hypothetical protein